MAGLILGCYGFQRSGKTFISVLLSTYLQQKYGLPVYTNINSEDFIKISSLNEIPLDMKPKILLIDEAYRSIDSRNWVKNTQATKFFNTIGKQNILFIITAPFPDMIEMRIREQQNYVVFAKGDKEKMTFKMYDCQRLREKVFVIPKIQDVFNMVHYDTLDFPDEIKMEFDKF